MTQKELILEYIKEHGSIVPARMGGRVFKGTMFGSETPKRCRELRAERELTSNPWKENPKFEEFKLKEKVQSSLIF